MCPSCVPNCLSIRYYFQNIRVSLFLSNQTVKTTQGWKVFHFCWITWCHLVGFSVHQWIQAKAEPACRDWYRLDHASWGPAQSWAAPVTCLPIVTVTGHSDQKSRVRSKSFPRQSTEHSSFADRKIICFIHRGISICHSCEERSKWIKSRCLGGPGPRHISAFTKPCQRMQPQQSIKIFNVLSLPLYLHHW